MNSTVILRHEGEIALLLIDNPPVNALSRQVREQLLECLHAALADDAVTALVIACEGKTFVAGADIKEFDLPLQPPQLPDVLALIENAAKPVVAAVQGSALGGGLELALACHYRIAERGAQFALPEVSLGLIPGAGGTQRLPRLCGMQAALEMVVGGERISGERALQLGLIDRLVADELRAGAIALAREVAGQPPRRLSEQQVPGYDSTVFRSAPRNCCANCPARKHRPWHLRRWSRPRACRSTPAWPMSARCLSPVGRVARPMPCAMCSSPSATWLHAPGRWASVRQPGPSNMSR